MRAVVWAAAAVTVAACSSPEGGPEHAGASTPPSLAAPSDSSAPPEESALEAYRALMRTVVDASLEGAEDHPDLERYARGQALELTTDMLDGAVAAGEPVLRPEVADADLEGNPATVVVEDCMDTTEWVLEGHPPRDASEAHTRLYTATLVLEEEQWQVEELWAGEPGVC